MLFLIILVRIVYVQTIEYKKLSLLADDLWSRELPITAERGKILDRNGVILATNKTTSTLIIIPNQVEDKKYTAKIISEILNVSYDTIYERVNKKSSIERVHPEGRRLNKDIADKIISYNLPGVYLVKESQRYYPYSDAKGNRLDKKEVYESPVSGMDIVLTIDYNIQKSIERELDNIIDILNPDNALVVAMNPNTGEILGMGSRPGYDPNNYSKYNMETISRNLPIWMTYEPGSTFKIITTASAVEEGVVNLEKDTFYDTGSVKVTGSTLRCWKAGGHGHQTFLQVFENSCNPGFVSLGFKLGKEKLFSYIDLFGFGEQTGIDLNGEGSGIIFSLNNVHDLELATTAFGQGVSVTPIQQVTAVSSIVNGGYLYKPYVLNNIYDSNTNTIFHQNEKSLVRKTISSNTSKIMRMALESVVARGGGKKVYIDGYRVGGKTGTAQKVQNGVYLANNYIMSFMAVLPAPNPEVVLYLAIDNPKKTALLSSYTTTPYVRKILLDIINIMKIEKQSNQIEKDYEWNDKKYYEVENVIGKTKSEAKKLLTGFDISYVGDGNIVKEQTPKAGERYYQSGKIRLLMGE